MTTMTETPTIVWSDEMITELKPNQIFVFGSNDSGFHGAGAAGMAMRGDPSNSWRSDSKFRQAMYSPDHQGKVGKWAVFGVGRGLQHGTEGRSWAVATIKRPGELRSVSLKDIYYQLIPIWDYAKVHPEDELLMTPLGEGYAGYSAADMKKVWDFLVLEHGLPSNIRFVGRPRTDS